MHFLQFMWLALLIVFILVEAFTTALVSMWFCLGSLFAIIVSIIAPEMLPVQLAVFAAVSVLALALLRPLTKKYLHAKHVPTNADANIGKMCQVVTEVQPGRFGRVKLEGLEWTAKADEVLTVGTKCRVNAIEGVKLVVSKVDA